MTNLLITILDCIGLPLVYYFLKKQQKMGEIIRIEIHTFNFAYSGE